MKRICVFLLCLSACLHAKPVPMDVFSMQMTGCYGTCPSFEVQVFADGVVVFNGERHTQLVGIYRLANNPELFQEITRLLDESNFQQFPESVTASRRGEPSPCRESWTDDSTTILSLQQADQQKKVQHYQGCKGFPREAELAALEKKLIELTGITEFISNSPANSPAN